MCTLTWKTLLPLLVSLYSLSPNTSVSSNTFDWKQKLSWCSSLDTLGWVWSLVLDKNGWMKEAVGMVHYLIICAWLNEVRGQHTTATPMTCTSSSINVWGCGAVSLNPTHKAVSLSRPNVAEMGEPSKVVGPRASVCKAGGAWRRKSYCWC